MPRSAWPCGLRIGDHRIQLQVGSGDHAGAIVLRAGTHAADASAHSVMVRVADVDAHHARAVAAGASVSGTPGSPIRTAEGQYSVRDPWAWVDVLAVGSRCRSCGLLRSWSRPDSRIDASRASRDNGRTRLKEPP